MPSAKHRLRLSYIQHNLWNKTKILSIFSSYGCTSPQYHPGSQFVPSRSFSVQRTSTSVLTWVEKLGDSLPSFNFAGSFLFLPDLLTFSFILLCILFESLASVLSLFVDFPGLSLSTFDLDFSLISNAAKMTSGSWFEEVASIVGALCCNKSWRQLFRTVSITTALHYLLNQLVLL